MAVLVLILAFLLSVTLTDNIQLVFFQKGDLFNFEKMFIFYNHYIKISGFNEYGKITF